MERIVKKGDWGLYQSPLFWLLLQGGFTPSTSKVASLRAEQFPTAEGEQSGAPNEVTWSKVAERLGLWGSYTPPRLGAQASVNGSGVPSAADPRLPGVRLLSGAWRRSRSLQMKYRLSDVFEHKRRPICWRRQRK